MGASKIESEYNEINAKDGWIVAFQQIKERSELEAKEKKFTLDECNKTNNRRLNRYRDVSPYDHSRIVLHRGDVDYINANLVKVEKANRRYILTQGPLQNTVGHFWLMVWEQNSKAILMLNKIIEKKQIKCHQYWPEHIGPDHRLQLSDVGLSVEYLRSEEFTNFSKRTFRLSDIESAKSREVIQFHYTTWPDFCIPSSPIAFLQFLKQVRDSGALNSDVGPAIVHCSAGIGRSGTFCLVDSTLVLYEKDGENKWTVCDILLEMRQHRMGLIQTADQLFFSYQAIIDGIKHLKDPSFNDYEEVPVIKYEENDTDEIPPPLPPPRIGSLTTGGGQLNQKPLPIIPSSASAHEFLEMEARNNSENLERTRNATISGDTERPLPPLPPKDGSLDKVNESDSNDEDDDEEEIDENYSDEDYEDDLEEEGRDDEDDNKVKSSPSEKLFNGNDDGSSMEGSFDADGTLPPSPSKSSNTTTGIVADMNSGLNSISSLEGGCSSPDSENTPEVRRRKRIERQTAMEEKIRVIKRKQRASEAAAANAPKKRRSLVIFSGVVICVLCCAYVYSKFG